MAKKTTLQDVAKYVGVSKTTVSFFLNGRHEHMSAETQAKISTALKELNYTPPAVKEAPVSRTDKRVIGIMLRSITNGFSSRFLRGINSVLGESCLCHVFESDYDAEKEKSFINEMTSFGADGMIIQPSERLESFWRSSKSNHCMVLIDNSYQFSRGCWVTCDFYGAVHDTLNLMIERGYEQFVIITAPPNDHPTREERISGLTDNLEHMEKTYSCIYTTGNTNNGEIASKLAKFLHYNVPTCIFVCNDWLLPTTFAALTPFRKNIPQQIGLIGLDCNDWSYLTTPSITTLEQPAFEEGQIAARILLDQIDKTGQVMPNRILKFSFHERESTLRKNRFVL